jgi:hypothetical protein
MLFDILKWPTCDGPGHTAVEDRISELIGFRQSPVQPPPAPPVPLPLVPPPVPMPGKVVDSGMLFLRAANKWAREHRYDLAAPVPPPPSAQ